MWEAALSQSSCCGECFYSSILAKLFCHWMHLVPVRTPLHCLSLRTRDTVSQRGVQALCDLRAVTKNPNADRVTNTPGFRHAALSLTPFLLNVLSEATCLMSQTLCLSQAREHYKNVSHLHFSVWLWVWTNRHNKIIYCVPSSQLGPSCFAALWVQCLPLRREVGR